MRVCRCDAVKVSLSPCMLVKRSVYELVRVLVKRSVTHDEIAGSVAQLCLDTQLVFLLRPLPAGVDHL